MVRRYNGRMKAASVGALNTRSVWLADLAACAATGVVLGAVGPFGSFFNDALPVRIGYWTLVLVISGAVFGLALRWVLPRARRLRVSAWVWVPLLVLVVSVAPAAISRLLAVGLWPGIRHSVGLVEWYGQAVLIGLIYVVVYILIRVKPLERTEDEPGMPRQLPKRLNRTLICLQMEDHYVRVHAAGGSELVLMSLSQAIANLDGIEGLQTHRSWWVAKAAVTGVVEDGRNLRLVLSNGLHAPVSRSRVAELRAAGWLGGATASTVAASSSRG